MYFLSIPTEHKNALASIRHWEQLKLATKDQEIWIKGFSEEQIESATVKSMGHKSIFVEKDQLLFHPGGLVPIKKMPSGLLWSPIDIALPLDRFKYNNNFFGVQHKVKLNLIPDHNPKKTMALLVAFDELNTFIDQAPAVRLKGLNWCRIDDQIMVFGEPILPLKGKSFWFNNNIFLPSGWNFEFSSLSRVFSEHLKGNYETLIYLNESEQIIVPNSKIRPLTIGSFRLTFSTSR